MTRPKENPYAAKKKRQDAYVKYLASGKLPTEAREMAGISAATVRDWRKEDPDFAAAEQDAEASAAEDIEKAMRQAALDGYFPAQKEWLDKRSRERWAPSPTVVKNEQLIAVEAGPRLERIAALMQRLEERKALKAGEDVIDV
jgi:hypothetical protein